MADASAEDLLSLSREVGRAWIALTRWRGAIAADPAQHGDDDPLESLRRVAGKSTWDALRALVPSAYEVPLRDALQRWVVTLTQARIGRPDEAALARLASEPSGQFTGEPPRVVSWAEAWRGLASSSSEGEGALWLSAAAQGATAIADARRTRAARRMEVARRFGLDHPWQGEVSVSRAALRDAAGGLLDATEDLSFAEFKSVWRRSPGIAATVQVALGREAGEGWPSQLHPRWLEQVFGSPATRLRLELPRLPPAVGSASFVRALYACGFAVRQAAAPASMPFALAHAPGFAGAHRLGFVFAALAADVEWQMRVLGVGRRVAHSQVRVVARALLADVRLQAARILLGDDAAPAGRADLSELGERLFGAAPDPRFAGAWPHARADEPSRLVALLQAPAYADGLRDRFDSDWFRNPRAWAELRASGAVVAEEPVDPATLGARVERLARGLEAILA